ncbi:hypothetical protein FPS10_25495 [Pseudoruegeria sp. M32A2M]|nr:hypothetical protein [Pseudoruegeria sp. M32A2M]
MLELSRDLKNGELRRREIEVEIKRNLDPPERAVVLCVDEKSQIQALDRLRAAHRTTATAPTISNLRMSR